jgi:phytoene dehydrogenase-like protein
MTMPTMYDPSLAPPGHHIMGIFLQYAPYTLRDTTWEQEREPYTERILDVIEEYCPNIRSIVVERQTLSPWDLEQRFGITGGNIFHGEMSLDQMFVLRPLARIPAAASWAPPATMPPGKSSATAKFPRPPGRMNYS